MCKSFSLDALRGMHTLCCLILTFLKKPGDLLQAFGLSSLHNRCILSPGFTQRLVPLQVKSRKNDVSPKILFGQMTCVLSDL